MKPTRAFVFIFGGVPILVTANGFWMSDPRDNNNEHVLAGRDNNDNSAQLDDSDSKTTVIKTTLTTTTTIPSMTPTTVLAKTITPLLSSSNTTSTVLPTKLTNALTITSDEDDSDPAAGFLKTCFTWQVWDANNHLWAKCRARGKGHFFWSRIGLDHMLGNVGGRLVYQKEGYFSSSCVSCNRKRDTTSYLQCECKDNKGEFQTTSIDLNLYLANHDGFICSEYQCGVREDPPPGSTEQ